jgi:hypothetical protein
MTAVEWLIKSSISGVPSLALVWANKLIAFFKNSPEIALRAWRPDADSTAAALGSLVIIVLAVLVPLIPWRGLRGGIAVLFLLTTIFAAWKCYDFFNLLDTVRMTDSDVKQIQAIWRYWYIAMLCLFVAAMTCGLSTVWSDGGRNDETADTETPQETNQ